MPNLSDSNVIVVSKVKVRDVDHAIKAVKEVYRDKFPLLVSETDDEFCFRIEDTGILLEERDSSVVLHLRDIFGLRLQDVYTYHNIQIKDSGIFAKSFNHTWALYAWSIWLQTLLVKPNKLVLLHLDAHSDLAAPPIISTHQSGVYHSFVGDSVLDISRPVTIRDFIMQGFIGIGGFIVPLLHYIPQIDFIHIRRQSPYVPKRQSARLEKAFNEVLFLDRKGDTPAVKIEPTPIDEVLRGGHSYIVTDDLSIIEQIDDDCLVLLDVDLDFFCNRFDDAEQDGHHRVLDKSLEEVCEYIELVSDYIRKSKFPVAVATLAISPGFFPSEYWGRTLPKVEKLLKDVVFISI